MIATVPFVRSEQHSPQQPAQQAAQQSEQQPEQPTSNEAFVAMLPQIRNIARYSFRRCVADRRDELVAEAIANAYVAYKRLVQRGKADLAFPSALARYAVKQIRAGRRVGCRFNAHDVMSAHAQRAKGFRLERLDQRDRNATTWREAVVNDPRTPVFHQVWFRIDFPEWLSRLSRRNRQIVKALAHGDSTTEVAQRFDVTKGTVSQLRRAFAESWFAFHADKRLLAA